MHTNGLVSVLVVQMCLSSISVFIHIDRSIKKVRKDGELVSKNQVERIFKVEEQLDPPYLCHNLSNPPYIFKHLLFSCRHLTCFNNKVFLLKFPSKFTVTKKNLRNKSTQMNYKFRKSKNPGQCFCTGSVLFYVKICV